MEKLINNVQFDIENFITNYISERKADIGKVNSNLYMSMKDKFNSQKTEARQELVSVQFDQYAAEAENKIQYLMLKDNIKNFVLSLESEIGNTLFLRDDDGSETIASRLLEEYIDSIECEEDLYTDYANMMKMLKDL